MATVRRSPGEQHVSGSVHMATKARPHLLAHGEKHDAALAGPHCLDSVWGCLQPPHTCTGALKCVQQMAAVQAFQHGHDAAAILRSLLYFLSQASVQAP